MNINSGWTSDSISTLFSGLSTSTSKSSSTSGLESLDLSTYGLIKSGTYSKMMKAYYSEDTEASTSTSTSKDSAKTLTSIKGASDDLVDSAEDLYKSSSLFNKKTSTTSDGTTTSDYDRDAIYDAVSSFAEDYNTMVSAAGKSNTTSIANGGAAMVNMTKNNASLLSKVGISIDSEDYTLSVDEDTFKKADMSDIKTLFSGQGSFAYSVAVKASMLNSYATTEASKSNTYTGSGTYTYNYTTGELYNSTL